MCLEAVTAAGGNTYASGGAGESGTAGGSGGAAATRSAPEATVASTRGGVGSGTFTSRVRLAECQIGFDPFHFPARLPESTNRYFLACGHTGLHERIAPLLRQIHDRFAAIDRIA